MVITVRSCLRNVKLQASRRKIKIGACEKIIVIRSRWPQHNPYWRWDYGLWDITTKWGA